MLTEESPYIDLVFSLTGQSLPLDNGYIVYSALSRICPAIHELDNISIHPIAGIPNPPPNNFVSRNVLSCKYAFL
jgi:CRISPR-associated endonuclease/helicase Cas3